MFGARGDVGDCRGDFLPGVASGLLVLCGSFLFGRDWGAFRLWRACSRMGRFLRRFGVGRFGAWLAGEDRRVIGRGVVISLGSGCFGMAVGAHISLVVSGVFLRGVLAGVWRG